MNEITLIYSRVSTTEQDVDSQTEDVWGYVTETLGVEPENIEVRADKSSGGNVDRSGYREMMELAKSGDIDRVVVREVSRIARNMRDLNKTVGTLVDDNDVSLHIMDAGLQVGEDDDDSLFDDRLILQILGIAAEIEHKLIKDRTQSALNIAQKNGKHVGRPPFGFETDDDGYLIPDQEEYDRAVQAIEGVDEMGWSERQAARHTGTARSTVRNILERKEFYLGREEGDS